MDKHSDSVMYGGMEVYNIWGTTTVDSIIGESDVMRALKNRICKIGNSDSTVAITGESGTGKELIARAIHQKELLVEQIQKVKLVSLNWPMEGLYF